MKTKAIRLYGKDDLRLEEFELPAITDNEILAKVVCDSLCMSSYKAARQGADHKRIPNDVEKNPIVIGHEFSGEIVELGAKWAGKFKVGSKFSIQPAINYESGPVGILGAPGYSYKYIGGDATYVVIPNEVMERECLLAYSGEGYYSAALAEPFSCVIGAMHASYHTTPGSYNHKMGIIDGGSMAILAGTGPMGLAAINYTLHRNGCKPKLLVVTDIDEIRLARASQLYSPEKAAQKGIDLRYVNTAAMKNIAEELNSISEGAGFDDVFVFAPVEQVIMQADDILAPDGCLNFFAGPTDRHFKAPINFYNVHYQFTHIVGTSGGNSDDMVEALYYFSQGLDPAGLITHVGGLNAVAEATLHLPEIPGGKKLIYTHISMPLTAIDDFAEKGLDDPFFAELDNLVKENNGLWSVEAEKYLLKYGRSI